MQIERLASLTLIGATSVWGLFWVPLYYLEARGLDGMFAIAVLNLAPALVLLVAAFWSKASGNRMRRALWVGAIAGLGFGLYGAGIVYGSVVRATLLSYLTPVWSTIIGMVVLSERVTWRRWLAIVVGLSGVALLVSGGHQTDLSIGDLFALASGLAWAICAVLVKRSPELPLTGLTGSQFGATALLSVSVALALGVDWPSADALLENLPIGSLIALGVFTPSMFAIFWAQKHIFPGRAGLLMMSEVLVAVISAAIFLPEERLGLLQWIGATMIVGTFFIENGKFRLPRRRHRA